MSIVNKVKIKNSDGTYTTADIGASAANIQMSDGNSLQTDYNDLNTGKAPTNHGASTQEAASAYGLASSSVYGHMKVGTGLSASNGTVSVSYGTSATTACVGNDRRLSDDRTPVPHAASTDTYGAGTDSNYGHVMIVNNFAKTNQSGVALSAYGGNKLANSIASVLDKNLNENAASKINAGTQFYLKDNILRKAASDIAAGTAITTTNAPAAGSITSQINNLQSNLQECWIVQNAQFIKVLATANGSKTVGTLLQEAATVLRNLSIPLDYGYEVTSIAVPYVGGSDSQNVMSDILRNPWLITNGNLSSYTLRASKVASNANEIVINSLDVNNARFVAIFTSLSNGNVTIKDYVNTIPASGAQVTIKYNLWKRITLS